jgi:hypothetical protein
VRRMAGRTIQRGAARESARAGERVEEVYGLRAWRNLEIRIQAADDASGETAEIGLDLLPPGEHAAMLAIWAPGGQAAAAVIPLPRLCVSQRP